MSQKHYVAEYRWKPVAGIGPEQHWETFSLPSLAAAKRAAKALVGSTSRHTWLTSVNEVTAALAADAQANGDDGKGENIK